MLPHFHSICLRITPHIIRYCTSPGNCTFINWFPGRFGVYSTLSGCVRLPDLHIFGPHRNLSGPIGSTLCLYHQAFKRQQELKAPSFSRRTSNLPLSLHYCVDCSQVAHTPLQMRVYKYCCLVSQSITTTAIAFVSPSYCGQTIRSWLRHWLSFQQ